MSTAKTAGPVPLGTVAPGRSRFRAPAAGAAVATLVNSALWVGGRAADVSFAVPGSLVSEVDFFSVLLTTPLIFTVGWGLLTVAARRSRRWVSALLVVAVLFAVVSSAAPLTTAADTASGLLLAAMHLLTGTAFLVTASIARAR
jgi:hypothetical protein